MENHRNLHCFSPHIFLCKAIRNLSIQQDGKGTGCWLYLAVELLVAVVGNNSVAAVIMQQIFNELIGGKFSLSQRIKTKQVFVVFDGKENTSRQDDAVALSHPSFFVDDSGAGFHAD